MLEQKARDGALNLRHRRLRQPTRMPRSTRSARAWLRWCAHYQLIEPFLLVSTSSDAPVPKRKACMFFVKKVRACGSMTLRP